MKDMIRLILFFLGDTILFFMTLFWALFLRQQDISSDFFLEHAYPFVALFIVYEVILYVAGFWDRRFVPTAQKIFDLLVPSHLIATVIMVMFFYLMPFFGIAPKTNLVIFSILLFIVMFVWKIIGGRVFMIAPTRALLVGIDDGVRELLDKYPLWNVTIVKAVAENTTYPQIQEILTSEQIDTVLVCVDRYPRIDILYKLNFSTLNIIDTAVLKEDITKRVDLDKVDELWFIRNVRDYRNQWQSYAKRIFDLLLAIPLGLAFVLVLPFVYIAIKRADGGPIFVSSPRVGLGGQVFSTTKFRCAPLRRKQNRKNKLITKIGSVLHHTAIDELPQFWAIIKGHLSFVGPRPEQPKQVEINNKAVSHYNMRHLCKPGLTGWSQIQYSRFSPENTAHKNISSKKLAFDLYYVKNNSLFLYFKIILQTIKIVVSTAWNKNA